MKENSFRLKGFLVWAICAFFFLYEFLLRTVIGTFQTPVMQTLHLTSFQFSLLSTTIFFLIYGVMQIPAGIIVSNIGLKKSLVIASLTCAIASLCFSYTNDFYVAAFFRLMMGFGASFGFICLLIAVYDWMPHRYNAVFIGLSQFIGTLGPMLAAGPLESLSESKGVSWRFVFLCLGGAGFALTLLVALFVENNQEKTGRYVILNRPEKILTMLKRLFTRTQPWFIAVFSASIYFTIEYLSENEGRNFLALKGINLRTASYMLTIAWLGFAIGCPLLGFISDMIKRRKIVMLASALFAVSSISTIVFSREPTQLLIAFFFLGMSASGQSVAFAMVAEQFKKPFVAVGFGLNNAMITIVSSLNAPLIGFFLDKSKRDVALLSLDNYITVFSVLIATAVLALMLIVFFIRETYCKSMVDFNYLTVKK